MDYKHHLLRLMVDMRNSMAMFMPSSFKLKKINEKDFVRRFGSIEEQIKKIFSDGKILIGSFHTTKNNDLIAYLLIDIELTFAKLESIYVDPYYRRIRIGKVMTNLAIDTLKTYPSEINVLDLDVLLENKVSIKIYNTLGFKPYKQSMYIELDKGRMKT